VALSTLSTSTLEEVSEACAGSVRFLQLYVSRDREAARRLVARADRAGYSAIFLTVDAPVFGKRRAQRYNPASLAPHLQSAFELHNYHNDKLLTTRTVLTRRVSSYGLPA